MYQSSDLFPLTTGLTNRLVSSLQEVEMFHSKASCHFTILLHGSLSSRRILKRMKRKKQRMKRKNSRTKNKKKNLFHRSLRKQKK